MKKLLVIVDYQKDFVDGSLGFQKAVDLEAAIVEKLQVYKQNGHDVVFTLDTHDKDYLLTREGKNLPIVHCIENTSGWLLYGKVSKLCENEDKCFLKNTFGSDELFFYLRENEYEQVELAGVVSNICVISNAVLAKTALPQANIIVDANCVASNDDELNNAALKVMSSLQIEILH